MGSSRWVIWAVGEDGAAPALPRKQFNLLDEDVLWTSAALAGALLFGAIVFAVLQRWKRRQLADEDTDLNNVTSYRAMLASGELSREEYDRVLKRVGQRALGKEPPAAAPPRLAPPKESDPPQPNQ